MPYTRLYALVTFSYCRNTQTMSHTKTYQTKQKNLNRKNNEKNFVVSSLLPGFLFAVSCSMLTVRGCKYVCNTNYEPFGTMDGLNCGLWIVDVIPNGFLLYSEPFSYILLIAHSLLAFSLCAHSTFFIIFRFMRNMHDKRSFFETTHNTEHTTLLAYIFVECILHILFRFFLCSLCAIPVSRFYSTFLVLHSLHHSVCYRNEQMFYFIFLLCKFILNRFFYTLYI